MSLRRGTGKSEGQMRPARANVAILFLPPSFPFVYCAVMRFCPPPYPPPSSSTSFAVSRPPRRCRSFQYIPNASHSLLLFLSYVVMYCLARGLVMAWLTYVTELKYRPVARSWGFVVQWSNKSPPRPTLSSFVLFFQEVSLLAFHMQWEIL